MFENIFLRNATSLNYIVYQYPVYKVIIVCKQFQFQQRVLYQVTPGIILLLRFFLHFEFPRWVFSVSIFPKCYWIYPNRISWVSVRWKSVLAAENLLTNKWQLKNSIGIRLCTLIRLKTWTENNESSGTSNGKHDKRTQIKFFYQF